MKNFFLKLVEELRLNLPEFNNDIQQQKLADKVDKDFVSGMLSGVNGTPAFYVNGKNLMTAQPT
ncbi:MAG: hypothetical protein ABJB11_01915 [Ferruginibacter sp.]